MSRLLDSSPTVPPRPTMKKYREKWTVKLRHWPDDRRPWQVGLWSPYSPLATSTYRYRSERRARKKFARLSRQADKLNAPRPKPRPAQTVAIYPKEES